MTRTDITPAEAALVAALDLLRETLLPDAPPPVARALGIVHVEVDRHCAGLRKVGRGTSCPADAVCRAACGARSAQTGCQATPLAWMGENALEARK